MKKLFCLLTLGLIVGLVVSLHINEGQQVYAREIPDGIDSDSETHIHSKSCFSMFLDTPLNPRSRIHETGTGLGAIPRGADLKSKPLFSIDLQGDKPNSRSLSSRGVAANWGIWKHSDTMTRETGNTIVLRVSFLGGTVKQRAAVKRIAPEWSKHANVRFEFVEVGRADIRVGFDPNDGNWSRIGSSAIYFPSYQKTMNLAIRGEYDRDRIILHEFGHALGLKHEHQNPAIRIPWNETAIINELKRTQGWSEETIRHNVINRLNVSETNFSAFDPNSIMIYRIPNRWTLNNFESDYNSTLSTNDKRFIGTLYKKNAPPIKPPTKPMGRILNVRVEYNQTENRKKGMRIRATFEIDRYKGQPGIVCAYFYRENGTPLKDRNRQYHATDGNVAAGGWFRPGYVNTTYRDYAIFIPYSELHTGSGRHDLKFMVQIFNRSTGKALSDASNWAYFWVRIG